MGVHYLLIVAAAALIFFPLERLVPLRRGQAWLRPGLSVDLLHLFVSAFLIRAGMFATTLLLSIGAYSLVPSALHHSIRAQPDWLEFLELLILSDLGFYIAHRIVHSVPWLWRFHAVHHSSEQMDWIAAYRVHPVDQVFNSTIIALPAIALGFSAAPLLVFAFVYRWHAMLLHSNVAIGLGPLSRIVTTPTFHHWHHADEPQAHDKNFGGQLVIWDRLFGTIHHEDRLPERYGIGGSVPLSYSDHLLGPFRRRRKGVELNSAIAPGARPARN